MNQRRQSSRFIFCISVAFLSYISNALSSDIMQQNAESTLFDKLLQKNTQLSDSSASRTDRFQFRLIVDQPDRPRLIAHVARNADRRGMAYFNADGQPICLVNNGFIALFDDESGSFLICDQSQPKLYFAADAAGISLDIGLSPDDHRVAFIFDPVSLLKVDKFIKSTRVSADHKTVTVYTDVMSSELRVAKDAAEYPLESVKIDHPKVKILIDHFSNSTPAFLMTNRKTFSRLGVPFRSGDWNDIMKLYQHVMGNLNGTGKKYNDTLKTVEKTLDLSDDGKGQSTTQPH